MFVILLIMFQMQPHTDWSDGPGYPGPWNVPSGGFWEEENIEWYESPGNLLLDAPSERYTISDSIYGGDTSIISADVNADGADDIFYGTWNPSGVGWFENNGGGTSWIFHEISSQAASHVDVGDPDGDGDPDLLVASGQDNVLVWFQNQGNSWIRHDLSPVASHPQRLFSADMDNDGDEDLISFSTDETVSWYENMSGTGTSWTMHLIWSFPSGSGLRWLEMAELDGDGSPEFIAALHDAGDIMYLNMLSSPNDWELISIDSHSDGWEWDCVDAADLDCDGDQDVVATRISGNISYIHWFENGNSWHRTTAVHEYFYETDYIRLADLDCNGYPDILTSGEGSNPADIWFQTGEPEVQWYLRRGPSGNPGTGNCVTCGDFDSDGIEEPAAVMSSSVHGSLQWCDLTYSNFPLTGSLTSSIFQVPIGTDYLEVLWGDMLWEAYEPLGTSIAFQIRASSDYNDMGEWSDTILVNGTNLSPLLPDDGIYVQCRAILTTDNSDSTPILKSFDAEGWVPGSAQQNADQVGISLTTTANPSHSSIAFQISLCEMAATRLTIYDVSGRIATDAEFGELPAGSTVYLTPQLVPGVYFARLTAGNREKLLRLLVIE